ncbi:MAG: hypothetical protein ACR2N4_00485 [Jatrophihabitans sp.]
MLPEACLYVEINTGGARTCPWIDLNGRTEQSDAVPERIVWPPGPEHNRTIR